MERDPHASTPVTADYGRGAVAAHRFNNDLRYRTNTHEMQRQLTPPYVLEPVRLAMGGIDLDPCTEPDNPVEAERFYTIEDDGLVQPWCGPEWLPSVFVNPPYSKAKEPWIERCIEAGGRGQKVVLLIPAHTDTRIFQKAMQTASAVVFIKGRVKFGVLRANRRQEAASHPSALLAWNVDMASCAVLGRVVDMRKPASSGSCACRASVPSQEAGLQGDSTTATALLVEVQTAQYDGRAGDGEA